MGMPAGLKRYWAKHRRKSKKRGYSMARLSAAYRRSSKPKMTLPIAVIGGFAPLVIGTIQHGQSGGWTGPGDTALDYFTRSLSGYSPNSQGYGGHWNFRNMTQGALPIVVGIVIHKAAGRLGLNRLLARTGIPLIRI